MHNMDHNCVPRKWAGYAGVLLRLNIPKFTGSRTHTHVPLNQLMTEISCVPVQHGHLLEKNLLFSW